jgi:DNA replicative helicase MCM subunit Mcm2 (Cdc46/Mcm family)
MVTTLNARTSILAAMNPVNRLDTSRPLDVVTGLPAPLIGRFDIVMALTDGMDMRQCAPLVAHHLIARLLQSPSEHVLGGIRGHLGMLYTASSYLLVTSSAVSEVQRQHDR